MWARAQDYDHDALDRYAGIYIGGGNTFRMLRDFRERQMMPAIRRFIASGKPVFGGSAGAIVLGSDVMTCAHMDANEVGLVDTTGLSVVQDFAIWCHYKSSQDPQIERLVASRSLTVLAISERSGVMIASSEVSAMEYDGAYRFTEDSKEFIAPGQSCTSRHEN